MKVAISTRPWIDISLSRALLEARALGCNNVAISAEGPCHAWEYRSESRELTKVVLSSGAIPVCLLDGWVQPMYERIASAGVLSELAAACFTEDVAIRNSSTQDRMHIAWNTTNRLANLWSSIKWHVQTDTDMLRDGYAAMHFAKHCNDNIGMCLDTSGLDSNTDICETFELMRPRLSMIRIHTVSAMESLLPLLCKKQQEYPSGFSGLLILDGIPNTVKRNMDTIREELN